MKIIVVVQYCPIKLTKALSGDMIIIKDASVLDWINANYRL